MSITIINDCNDANAVGRMAARVGSLFGVAPTFVGVESGAGAADAHADLQAAGNVIDILDAAAGSPGVVLVNVAPRGGRGKQWPNGTPFGFFWYQQTLVCSTIDGLVLSLVKKLSLTPAIAVVDVEEVCTAMVAAGALTADLVEHIARTQFRSFEFLPRLAKFVWDQDDKQYTVPSEHYSIDEVADAPQAVWWVDNFGNCKTTLLAADIAGATAVTTSVGEFAVYKRLKDIPNDSFGLAVGSSGIGDKRFVELLGQGVSAAAEHNLAAGSVFEIT